MKTPDFSHFIEWVSALVLVAFLGLLLALTLFVFKGVCHG